MADRTSAEIFGKIFEYVAEPGPIGKQAFANFLWALSENYDFDARQMEADEALIKLGFLTACPQCREEPIDEYGEICWRCDDGEDDDR